MWTLILTDEQAQFLRGLLEMASASQADARREWVYRWPPPSPGWAGGTGGVSPEPNREAELTEELLAMLEPGGG
jgi:hypothetical protein